MKNVVTWYWSRGIGHVAGSLSLSHNVALLVDVDEYLLAHSVMLITSRSFASPNARWR